MAVMHRQSEENAEREIYVMRNDQHSIIHRNARKPVFLLILQPNDQRPYVPLSMGLILSFVLLVCSLSGLSQASSTQRARQVEFLNAAEQGDVAKIKALLVKGVNINIVDGSGQTALMKASENGSDSLTEFLLVHKAKVNAQDHEGHTALMRTITRLSGEDPTRLYAKRVQVIHTLLKHGADVNVKSRDGFTVLMWAAMCGNLDLVNVFLKRHADVNARDVNGTTALRCAKRNRRTSVVQRLKQVGATE